MNILDRFEFRGNKMVHVKARISDTSKFADYVPLDKILTEPKAEPFYYHIYQPTWVYFDPTFDWWEDINYKEAKNLLTKHYNGKEETCLPKTELLSRRELLKSPKHWAKLMSTVISSSKS